MLAAGAPLALPAAATANHTYGDTQWGTAGDGQEQFAGAAGLDADSFDNLYVADYDHHKIQKFSPDGEWLGAFGSFGSGDGQLNHPIDVAVDGNGDVWVADRGNHRIQKFTAGGSFLDKQGGDPDDPADGQFDTPFAVATDSGDNVYVADCGNHRVQKLDTDGNNPLSWGSLGPGAGQFNCPSGIAVTGSTVYVSDLENDRVQSFTTAGTSPAEFGSGTLDGPGAVDVAADGTVLVVDGGNNRVMHFTSSGGSPAQVSSGGTGDGQFVTPQGIAASSLNRFFVSDSDANRVQRFDGPATGSVVRTSGTRLIFEAATGDANDVEITGMTSTTFTAEDDAANSLQGAGGCVGSGPTTCTFPAGTTVSSIRVTTLDLADSVLIAGATAATVDGGNGIDALTGGDGGDTLTGGDGGDTLIGGNGNDTASYADAATGVTVNLHAGTATGPDTLSGIENATGGGQADTFISGAGANSFAGGGGADTVSYAASSTGVTASLTDNTGSGGDTFSAIESLTGSPHDDILTGSPAVNSVQSGAGSDTITINDATADSADCGDGADAVTADSSDTVGANCESVIRTDATPPDGGGGGGGGGGPAPGGPGTTPAPSAPVISGLAVTRMRSGRAGTFSYSLDKAASVTITIDQAKAGRKVGAVCKKQTRKNRKKRACTLFAAIGKLSQPGAAGRNTLRFSGRLGARKLKPGLYRATAVATGASGKSRPATAKFAVSR